MGLKFERCHLLMVLHVLKINFENHEQWITLLTPLLSVLKIGLLKNINYYLKFEIRQKWNMDKGENMDSHGAI